MFKKVESKKEVKNIHSGHRQRMRDKAYKYGFDSFEKHELLEMLLYSTVPQKDTNPIAHNLINYFGSFHAVFEAPVEELMKVKGMTKTSAFLLKMIPEISSEYLDDKVSREIRIIKGNDDVFDFFRPKYVGETEEVSYAMFLNNASEILGSEIISRGSLNFANIDPRKLVQLCFKYNATQVALSHNHPSGDLTPSPNDVVTTKTLVASLSGVGIRLIDHVIFTSNGCLSMAFDERYSYIFTTI